MDVRDYFDDLYRSEARYWWREEGRHATDPSAYPTSLLTQMTLRALTGNAPGRALDLGAGEGADSIRLALLGYSVEAVEISKIGADKISQFAEEVGVKVNVEVADIRTYQPDSYFDIVICNGVLHYVNDKRPVIERMQNATRVGGINVISAWTSHSPVPECHERVPVFCDDENGVILELYSHWTTEFVYFDRNKLESSHNGMPDHSHSHIKLVARRRLSGLQP